MASKRDVNVDKQYLEITAIQDRRGSFPGKQEGRQQKVLSLHTASAGIWKAPPSPPPNQKLSPCDSGISSDVDVWRATHDVVWKHTRGNHSPKKRKVFQFMCCIKQLNSQEVGE